MRTHVKRNKDLSTLWKINENRTFAPLQRQIQPDVSWLSLVLGLDRGSVVQHPVVNRNPVGSSSTCGKLSSMFIKNDGLSWGNCSFKRKTVEMLHNRNQAKTCSKLLSINKWDKLSTKSSIQPPRKKTFQNFPLLTFSYSLQPYIIVEQQYLAKCAALCYHKLQSLHSTE